MRGVAVRLARIPAWMIWLVPAIALAAIVSAADVANAIRSSPSASAFLRTHANAIGELAIRVESGGDTTAYNGSCCYGVLQLNTTNILASGMTVEQYRNATLQQQIDAWSRIQSRSLNDPVIRQLQQMTTFDGQPVDASLLLACVQLGQGNCRQMVRSGRCNGFADSNGTTICSMAATMRTAIRGTTPVPPTARGSGWSNQPTPGATVSGVGVGQAYERGAGVTMNGTNDAIKVVIGALMLTWLTWSALGTWQGFTAGRLALPDMTRVIVRPTVLTLIVLWMLA